MDRLDEFTEFAQARQAHLRRLAFLMCGDWHTAQDLTQTALLNLCRHWNRARRSDSVEAYAHRVLVNAHLGQKRKHLREQERAAAFVRDGLLTYPHHRAASVELPELRMTLLAALAQLAPGTRTVLVLRYWEDLSVEATAQALKCSTGNVKSQSSRGLAKLRELLGDFELTQRTDFTR